MITVITVPLHPGCRNSCNYIHYMTNYRSMRPPLPVAKMPDSEPESVGSRRRAPPPGCPGPGPAITVLLRLKYRARAGPREGRAAGLPARGHGPGTQSTVPASGSNSGRGATVCGLPARNRD